MIRQLERSPTPSCRSLVELEADLVRELLALYRREGASTSTHAKLQELRRVRATRCADKQPVQ